MLNSVESFFKNIDKRLLPKQENFRYGAYIWLIYLLLFWGGLITYHPVDNSYFYAAIGTVLFLVLYFNAYWVSAKRIHWNIISILVIGSLLAQLSPGASVFFIYAAAFCCKLGSIRNAFAALFIIALWISLLSWYFSYTPYFYAPALFFTFMIGGINIYQHEIDLKRKELVLSQQEVRHLARTSERERIARDLHDLIGHTFSVITLKAELAGKLIEKDSDKAREQILQLENISRDALQQVREVVSGYRTSDLNTEFAHAKYVLESNDISFNYRFNNFEMSETLNKELAIILKELVTNILKHAHASKVTASATMDSNKVLLQVRDDGQGFLEQPDQGFGIKGIRERIENLQGTLVIKSELGSHFIICVPLESVE